jgi:hypothetical protein
MTTGKYSERSEKRNWGWNEWKVWVREKKAINEQMNERVTYCFFSIEWKEKGNDKKNGNEGEGVMNGEGELTDYEWNQLTRPTWPGV